MSVLGRMMASWSAPAVSDDGHWSTRGGAMGSPSRAGVLVTKDVALSNPVVFDCNWILCDAVGQSPTILYDRTGAEERERSQTRLAYRLREQPNDTQTAIEFKRQMQEAANFFEFAYAEIEWAGAEPVQITPRDPQRMRIAKVEGGRRRYEFLEDDDRTWRPITPDRILRVPGRPVLRYAGETLGNAIALERYSARLFSRSPKPAAVLQAEKGVLYDDKQKAEIIRTLLRNTSGENAGGMAWVPEGLQLNPWGMTNEQAQYAELRTAIVGDITRFWRIPPYMIGLLESGTVSYASVNTQSVDFVVYCLMPWLVGWEQALQRDLIVRKDSQFVEFLTASLLRGTTQERYLVYQIALENGIMTVNEVRRLENLNPRPGGDQWGMPTPQQRSLAQQARAVSDSPEANRLLESYAQDAAGRVVRREQGALARVAEKAGPDAHAWERGVEEFYGQQHVAFVRDAMKLPLSSAVAWCERQKYAVLSQGPSAAAAWNGAETRRLAELALDRGLMEVAAA